MARRPLPDRPPIPPDEYERGLSVARTQRVAVFVVAYNAESHIRATLERIPEDLRAHLAATYVIDDSSQDATTETARSATLSLPGLKVFRTPYNQGYGGNQKLGYQYASRRGFDIVVLLHGDGQYAPEVLPRILAPFSDPATMAVFGSRMMERRGALRGGMPLYKYVGNRILTAIENRLLGTRLSEFHSGYRAYRVSALERIPYQYNTNDFHFDTEIIVQLLARGMRIVEVPIPTYYGDEICHVEGIPYAVRCVATVLRSRANRYYLVHHPKFDVFDSGEYVYKEASNTVHQFVLGLPWRRGENVAEIGAGHGRVARDLHARGVDVVATDLQRPGGEDFPFPFLESDLDGAFAKSVLDALGDPADTVVALDVIEHLGRPERALAEIRRLLRPGGRLVASTGNVGYVVVRAMLALGQFNYGKKGILDLTHRRLFTARSFARTLEGEGFRVESIRGFGPPIRDMVGKSTVLRFVDAVASGLARLWPALFGYQILVVATRLDDIDSLLDRTLASGAEKRAASPESVGPAVR